MTDRYDQDLLLDYLEGDLDPAARAQVDQMLASDPPLAALMRSLAQDREQLRSIPAEDAPGDLSLDLVQGLERRMLLDAPQVESGGPIPISRGRGMPPPTGGPRWGRILGLTGMAAAIALAAGAVIWFDRFANPLSQTALEMGQDSAPAAEAMPTDDDRDTLAMADAGEANASGLAAPGTPGTRSNDLARTARNEDPASLAERARQAMLDGAAADRAAELETSPITSAPNAAPPADAVALAQSAAMLANVTITAFAPNQALRIESDDRQVSQAQVLEWCLRNGVPIVEPQVESVEDPTLDGPTQIALLIEQEQLDALLSDLNRDTLEQRHNRQYATVDPADSSYYQQASTVPDAVDTDGPTTDTPTPQAEEVGPQIVELRVPEDLGDAVQTRLNVANTLMYSNRAELALAAQRDAEVMRNQQAVEEETPGMSRSGGARNEDPAADGPGQAGNDGNTRSNPLRRDGSRSRSGGGGSRAGDAPDPAAPGSEPDQPAERFADAADESDDEASDDSAPPMREDQEQAGTDEQSESAQEHDADAQPDIDDLALSEAGEGEATDPPPARGNWLLPQVPLAPSTPIWTNPPTAQLVPIVFVRRLIDEIPAAELGPDAQQPEPPREDDPE
ncbi:MAG: anti-sigma factor family protein [Phycisphaerales bacterium JB063]